MKHIFIINPKAGKRNLTEMVKEIVKQELEEKDYQIYLTKGVLDARQFVEQYCREHPEEKKRFYSCGGDGTLNEVANGAIGYENTEITCFPIGSGNDFVKYFGTVADFRNLPALIKGDAVDIDVLGFNERYVINIFNLGLDADVCDRMINYRRLPLVGGKGAYILGLIVSFFSKLTKKLKIFIDGEEFFTGETTLCAVANAICYGGGFYCAPHARVDDGLLDVVTVSKLSRLKFLKFVKKFKDGKHLDMPELKDTIYFKRGKLVEIEAEKPINCCFDGEVVKETKIKIEILPKLLKFIIPRKFQEKVLT
ncbi:MAG TPA: YegS/Rv2252/BmrU family lipid kinase [Acholeplasmataceae bacterium]|jgi:diacylglycerol kinase (ATP)|nr:YegS/Rv2252/BmrU family lipid kinase [Acholeplasmataceae bacterium]